MPDSPELEAWLARDLTVDDDDDIQKKVPGAQASFLEASRNLALPRAQDVQKLADTARDKRMKERILEGETPGTIVDDEGKTAWDDTGEEIKSILGRPDDIPETVTPGQQLMRAWAIRRKGGPDPRQSAIDIAKGELRKTAQTRISPEVEKLARSVAPGTTENLLGTAEETEEARQTARRTQLETLVEAGQLGAFAVDPVATTLGTDDVKLDAIDTLLKQTYPEAMDVTDEGLPLETHEGRALRFFGGIAPAVGQEAVYALPAAGLTQDGQPTHPDRLVSNVSARIEKGENVGDAIQAEMQGLGFGRMRIEEALMGTTPEGRNLLADSMVEDYGWLTQAFMRSMHKVEQGRMMGDDLEQAAIANHPKEDNLQTALRYQRYAAGLGAEFVVPWEAPGAAGLKAVRGASMVRKLPAQAGRARSWAEFMFDDGQKTASRMAGVLEAEIRGGTDARALVDGLPSPIRGHVNQMLEERGIMLTPPEAPPIPRGGDPSPTEILPKMQSGQTLVPPGPPAPPPSKMGQTLVPPDADAVQKLKAKATAQAAEGRRLTEEAEEALKHVPKVAKKRTREAIKEAVAPLQREIVKGTEALADRTAAIRRRAAAAIRAIGLDRQLRNANEYQQWADVRQAIRGEEGEAGLRAVGPKEEGQGFEKLKDLDPERGPETPRYRLEDREGKLVHQGTLRETLSHMTQRRNFGDAVRYSDHAPVAGWRGMSDDPKLLAKAIKRTRDDPMKPFGGLAHNFHHAGPLERAMIKQFAEQPKSFIPLDEALDQAGSMLQGTGAPGMQKITRDFVRFLFGGGKTPTPVRSLSPRDEAIVEAIHDATKAYSRSHMGNRHTVQVALGWEVTAHDYAAMKGRIDASQKALGYTRPTKLGKVIDGTGRVVDFGSDANRAAAKIWYQRYGIHLPDRPITDGEFTKMNTQMLKDEAGRSADPRWAIRGQGLTSQWLLDAMSDGVTAAKNKGGYWEQAARIPERLILGEKRIREAAVSNQAAKVLSGIQTQLRNAGRALETDLLAAMKEGGTPSEVIHRVIQSYRPIPTREFVLLEAIKTHKPATGKVNIEGRGWAIDDDLTHLYATEDEANDALYLKNKGALFALRNQVAEEVRDASRFPGLFSNDYATVKEAMTAYSSGREADLARLGRQVLKAAVSDSTVDYARISELLKSSSLSNDQLAQIWMEFNATGRFDGEQALSAIQDLWGLKVLEESTQGKQSTKLTQFALHIKADEIEREGLALLAEMEFGWSDPNLKEALDRVLNGTDAASYHDIPTPLIWKARNLINRMGLEPGAGAIVFKTLGKPDAALGAEAGALSSKLHLPPGWADEINRAKAAGVSGKDAEELGGWLFGLYKDGLTSANPAFHVTNSFGIPPMAYQEHGVEGVVRAGIAANENKSFLLKLTQKLSQARFYHAAPLGVGGNTLETPTGIHSLEEVYRVFAAHNAGQTQAAALSPRKLEASISRNLGVWNKIPALGSDIRDAVTGASDLLERTFKVSVGMAELKRGSSLEEAAVAARRALYDFDDLTDMDKWIANWGLVFWRFGRKNLDNFWKQAADNPHRLGAQLRLAREIHHDDSNEFELALKSDADLGRIVLAEMEGTDGFTYQISTGSVLTAGEGLYLTMNLLAPLQAIAGDVEGAKESLQNLAGQAIPRVQVGVATAFDTDVAFKGFRTDSTASNVMTDSLVEGPLRGWAEWVFEPESTRVPDERALDGATHYVGGRPSVFAPGGGMKGSEELNRNLWQYRTFVSTPMGRLMNTIQSFADVAAAEPPPMGRFLAGVKAAGFRVKRKRGPGESEGVLRAKQMSRVKGAEIGAENELR